MSEFKWPEYKLKFGGLYHVDVDVTGVELEVGDVRQWICLSMAFETRCGRLLRVTDEVDGVLSHRV